MIFKRRKHTGKKSKSAKKRRIIFVAGCVSTFCLTYSVMFEKFLSYDASQQISSEENSIWIKRDLIRRYETEYFNFLRELDTALILTGVAISTDGEQSKMDIVPMISERIMVSSSDNASGESMMLDLADIEQSIVDSVNQKGSIEGGFHEYVSQLRIGAFDKLQEKTNNLIGEIEATLEELHQLRGKRETTNFVSVLAFVLGLLLIFGKDILIMDIENSTQHN